MGLLNNLPRTSPHTWRDLWVQATMCTKRRRMLWIAQSTPMKIWLAPEMLLSTKTDLGDNKIIISNYKSRVVVLTRISFLTQGQGQTTQIAQMRSKLSALASLGARARQSRQLLRTNSKFSWMHPLALTKESWLLVTLHRYCKTKVWRLMRVASRNSIRRRLNYRNQVHRHQLRRHLSESI